MPTLFINSDAVVKFTNKLEQLSHTALPNIIRETLNTVALDVKQVTMPASSNVFKHRQANFFTANSRVEFAKKTHNIKDLQSEVGFSETKLKSNGFTNNSVKELEQQEHSGIIDHRTYVPLNQARVGEGNMGLVKTKFRLSKIKDKIIYASNYPGKNSKEKFTRAAIAAGVGGYVVGTGLEHTFLFLIEKITKQKKPSVTNVITRKLYSVQKGRSVKVHETDFMAKASYASEKKMESIFIKLAEKRIERDLHI